LEQWIKKTEEGFSQQYVVGEGETADVNWDEIVRQDITKTSGAKNPWKCCHWVCPAPKLREWWLL